MTSDSNANSTESGIDELERLALEECVKRGRVDRRVSVLIVPASRCELAAQFTRFGAQVTLAGPPEKQQDIAGRVLAAGLRDDVRVVPYSLPNLPDAPEAEPYDIVLLHRGLCGLPYAEAKQVIRAVMQKMRIGGKLYLSILGLHSALGEDYPDAEEPIESRFSPLAPEIARTYAMPGKLCLYTERNLFMLLLESGASVLRTFTTTYGNVKAVAVRV
jgi:hypothetical protein